MSDIVACPSCGASNRVPSLGSGQKAVCGKCKTPLTGKPVEVTDANFDQVLADGRPTIVDFWAPWCGPCRVVTPVVDDFARTHAGELKVVKLNTDTAPEIANRFGVQGIPLLVVLRDGDEVDRLAGAAPGPHIERWLEQQLAAEAPTR